MGQLESRARKLGGVNATARSRRWKHSGRYRMTKHNKVVVVPVFPSGGQR